LPGAATAGDEDLERAASAPSRLARASSASRQAAILARQGYGALFGRGTAFTHQPLGRHIDRDGLGGYYCDFRHKARAAAEHDDGFPRSSVTGQRAAWVIPVAQAALGYWELRLDGEATEARFVALADWLVENAAPGPQGLCWYMEFARPKYALEPGWISAMGQGEAISVLLRAAALTGSERYLATARAALGPMTVEVEQGGVLRVLAGAPVLEEYPAARPCAVLNGWIFALLGLHELVNVSGDERARDLFARSAAGLVSLLPRYDVGWWSLYSLYDHGRPDLAKPFYQRLHPVLLEALDMVHPDPALRETALRWESQVTTAALVRNSLNKLGFRAYRELASRRGGR